MIKRTALSFIIILSACLLYSNFLCPQEVRAGVDVLEFNPNARIKGLGGAGAAINGITTPLAVNPASMGIGNQPKLSFFYGGLSTSTHFGYVEYDYPVTSWAALGAASRVKYLNENNFSRDLFFGLSFDLFKSLSVGSSAGLISETLYGNTGEAFTASAGMQISPFKWMNLSAGAKNINSPVIKYGSTGSSSALTLDGRGGISIFSADFFNIAADFHILDINKKEGSMKIKESYGVEIYPFSSLAIRGGIACDTWHSGFGIISRDMDIDYAYVDRKEGFKHYIQYTRKFASPTTVREKELAAKEKILKKEQLYVRAQAEYNKEKIALANQLVQKYMEEYGKDKRILEIRDDIREWINKKREKNMGRVGELKNEILKDYYQGQIKEARRKLSNMKLLAPNYEETKYLSHLITAQMLLEEGKYQQSEDELVEALKINPDSVEVIDLHKRLQEVLKLNEEE